VHWKWEVVEIRKIARVEHWADVFPSWEDGIVRDEVVEVVCFHVNVLLSRDSEITYNAPLHAVPPKETR
jgi:hypothetical protein